MNLSGIVETVVGSIKGVLLNFAGSAIAYSPKIIVAFIITLIGLYFSKYAVRYAGPVVARTLKRTALIDITLRSIRYGVLFITILMVFSILGINLTPLLAGAGIAGIVVGITLAPVISGYLAGIFLLADRPYEVGDRIAIVDMKIEGYVREIGFRVSKILTTDGNLIVIPNNIIVNKDLVNYSAEDLRTRKELPISISYESDLEKAIEIMKDVAKETEGVITEGYVEMAGNEYSMAPQVFLMGFGDNGLDLLLRVWMKDPFRPKRRISGIYTRIFDRFKKKGIEIPYPHRDLVLKKDTLRGVKDVLKRKSRRKNTRA